MITGAQSEFGAALTICDRCGADTRRPAGAEPDWNARADDNPLEAHFHYQGAYGSLRHDFDYWKAELCEECAGAVRAFIDAGSARGVTVIDRLDADERFCREILGREASEVPRPIDEDTRARFTRWFSETYGVLPVRVVDDAI